MSAADEIAEKLAQRISLVYEPSIGIGTFTRWWQPQSGKLEADVLALLKATKTVTNPQYENGTKTAPGEWTVAHADWEPKLQGYVQALQLFPAQANVLGSTSGWNDGVAGNGTKVAEDLYEKTEQKDYFDQAAVPTVTPYAVGILKTLSVAIDRFRKWRVSITTKTAKYVFLTYSFTPRTGYTETHYIARNETPNTDGSPKFTGAPGLADGYENDLAGSPSRNPDGTWNWYIIKKPTVYGEFANGVTWSEGKVQNGGLIMDGLFSYIDMYRYTLKTSLTTKMFTTIGAAIEYSQSGVFGAILPGMQPYHIVGPGQVLGTRCNSYQEPDGLRKYTVTVGGP